MIHRSYQHCLCVAANLTDAKSDRYAHFTVWFRIYGEDNRAMLEPCAHVIRPMTGDDNDFLDSRRADVVNAGFNYGAVAEGKQWLEGAHAPGQSGGQNNCSNIFHVLSGLDAPSFRHLWRDVCGTTLAADPDLST